MKVTPSEEFEKGTKKLDDMKEAVVTIRGKDSDNFKAQSKKSTSWFNLKHKFFKRKFLTLEPDFYKNIYERDIESQDMEPYKTFVVTFDNTKLNLFIHNDPLTLNREKHIERF